MTLSERLYTEREFDHAIEEELLNSKIPAWDEAGNYRQQEVSWQEEESYLMDRRSDRWGVDLWEGDEDEDW